MLTGDVAQLAFVCGGICSRMGLQPGSDALLQVPMTEPLNESAVTTPSPVVVIAPADAVASLKTLPGLGQDFLIFPETATIRALYTIVERLPKLVVLQWDFLASSRAAALISRMRTDPLLHQAQIRVLSNVVEYTRLMLRRARAGLPPPTVVPGEPLPPDYNGMRRALRLQMDVGVAVGIDGNPAGLVDLSRYGAQVLVPRRVSPNQKVLFSLASEQNVVRCRGSIVWATLERSDDPGTHRYRAGVAFADADPDLVDAFCSYHLRR